MAQQIFYGASLAGYQWTAWNPTDVAGTLTNAPATGAADTAAAVTMANASGTLTITFNVAGKYLVSVTGQTLHTNDWTSERLTVDFGGTVTRRLPYQWSNDGGTMNENISVSATFLVSATAGQTLTLLPKYRLTKIGGTNTQHTASAAVTVLHCGI